MDNSILLSTAVDTNYYNLESVCTIHSSILSLNEINEGLYNGIQLIHPDRVQNII